MTHSLAEILFEQNLLGIIELKTWFIFSKGGDQVKAVLIRKQSGKDS